MNDNTKRGDILVGVVYGIWWTRSKNGECKTISISFLKQHNYLTAKTPKNGAINWSVNGNKTGRISIRVNTVDEKPNVKLSYECNDKPIN